KPAANEGFPAALTRLLQSAVTGNRKIIAQSPQPLTALPALLLKSAVLQYPRTGKLPSTGQAVAPAFFISLQGVPMASPAHIAANRDNAQKSPGPRTGEGKSASRMNALKHGADAESIILPGEDAELFQQLANEYRADLAPRGPLEPFQV